VATACSALVQLPYSAASASRRPSATITNSSPQMRAVVSAGRSDSRSRSAAFHQQLISQLGCPRTMNSGDFHPGFICGMRTVVINGDG
jgi:hypothetical protein